MKRKQEELDGVKTGLVKIRVGTCPRKEKSHYSIK
jgi:hypothetical protein